MRFLVLNNEIFFVEVNLNEMKEKRNFFLTYTLT